MWPFRRKVDPEAGPAAMAAPVLRHDWKGLAPIQRVIGDHPLTAAGDVFAGDLATHQDPSVVSRTLGHHVSADAPAGLVMAVTTPSTRQDGPTMVPRPRIQRRTASLAAESTFDDGGAPDGGSQPELPQAAAPPVSAARRELPVVTAEPALQRLTTTAPETEPVPVGPGRASASLPTVATAPLDDEPAVARIGDGAEPHTMSAPQRLTLGQSRRLGLGAPLRQVPGSSVQRTPADAPDLPLAVPAHRSEPSSPASLSIQELPTSPGLPAPLASITPPGTIARIEPVQLLGMPSEPAFSLRDAPDPATSFARRDLPLAPSSPAPPPTAAAAADAPGWADPSRTGELSGSTPTPAAMPGPTVQRLAGPGRSGAEPDAPGDDLGSTHPMAGLLTRSGVSLPRSTTVAPLIGSRPIQATMGLQRATPAGATAPISQVAPGPSARRAAPPIHAAPVTQSAPVALREAIGGAFDVDLSATQVDRSEQAAEATASLQALSLTQGQTISLPAAHGPAESGRGRSLLAHELTHVAQQRRHGSNVPAEDSPAGQRLELQAQSVERTAGRETPLALPLVPVASVASVQRATAMAASAVAASSAPVQRAEADPGSFSVQTPGISDAGADATGAPAQGPAVDSHHDEDMDALAGKIYDRIRSRLKSELLVDRERAGLLTDLR